MLDKEGPVVHTEQGLVRGKTVDNLKDGHYYSFQGIPYAEPPLRELRFKAPVKPKLWSGILNATAERDCCVCYDFFSPTQIVGSEDCLYLNVYTTKIETIKSKLKPVVVLISGAFTATSTIFGVDELLKKDVVFVSLNYRTGILGFLSLGEPSVGVAGNAGLKDVVLALTWVRNNIAKFGGDPRNVTLLGTSFGAVCAHLLTLAPSAAGLFHKIIALSGSALVPWGFHQNDQKRLARAVNCKSGDDGQVYRRLQETPARQLIGLFAEDQAVCSPVVDGIFLPDEPTALLRSGRFTQVPTIFGYSSDEGLLVESGKFKSAITPATDNYEHFVPADLKLKRGMRLSKEVGKEIKSFYYGSQAPSPDNVHIYHRLMKDIYVFRGVQSAANLTAAKSKQPVYLYRFAVDAKWNIYKQKHNIQYEGACHADILGYLFRYEGRPGVAKRGVEELTQHRLVTLFTNFAKNGDPNSVEADADIPVVWEPLSDEASPCLDIATDLRIHEFPDKAVAVFWDDLTDNVRHKNVFN